MREIEEKIYDYICEHEDENVDDINIALALDVDPMVVRYTCEKLVAEGLTNHEIADTLFISIRTVETHKNRIMTKLGLKTTAEMVKYAIKNHLYTP